MSKCPLQKKDVNHLPGTANKRRKSIKHREMKGMCCVYEMSMDRIVI